MKNTKIFAKTFDQKSFEQVYELSNSEQYKDSIIRIMPDAHSGKGCVIGTAMTIVDKITPNLVGVDIGCGMFVVELADKDIDFEKLDKFISNNIPNGKNVNKEIQKSFDFSKLIAKHDVDLDRAALSLGSLGGGNHFIEIAKSSTDRLYLIIHSGSRSLGNRVCQLYQAKAIRYLKEMYSEGVVKKLISRLKAEGREKEIQEQIKALKLSKINESLAYLEGADMEDYLNDMNIVQNYALQNREVIADRIIKYMGFIKTSSFHSIHNYIDTDRMILRKGAASAESGQTLIIPINMRDGSLLCIGKGNKDWNYSAPHGAGRLMSRSEAKKTIDFDEFCKQMSGVYTTSVCNQTIDEAPDAYKSIEEIKEAIIDTVDVIDTLKPVYNFKSKK